MTHYVSKGKLEELGQELKELQTTKRFEVAEKLKKAKEHGDLSENFEYAQAKEDQEGLERKILELEEIVKSAEVITKAGKKDTVNVGHTVTIKKASGEKIAYTIVGSQESDPSQNKISNTSPVGKVLIGKKVGETAAAVTPKGTVKYKIVSIT